MAVSTVAPAGYGKGAQTPKGQRRQDLILKTAATLFAERGFGQVSINDIGYAAGVTGPAIYRYFPSKEALLVSVYARLQRASGEAMDKAMEEDDDTAKVVALIDSEIALAIAQSEAIRLVAAEWQHLPAEEAAAFRTEARRQFKTWMSAFSRVRPDLSGPEVEATIHAVLAIVMCIAQRRSAKPFSRAQVDQVRSIALSGALGDAAADVR